LGVAIGQPSGAADERAEKAIAPYPTISGVFVQVVRLQQSHAHQNVHRADVFIIVERSCVSERFNPNAFLPVVAPSVKSRQARIPVALTRLLTLALIFAARLSPATLQVHSEFLRVNPQGEILPVDATPNPREILSPAVVRNGFASFHVVVRSPRVTNFFLFVAANPSNLVRATLYKEEFIKRGDDWIPDVLKPLRSPNFGAIPDGEASIPGQTACVYLLDVWVPPEAPPGTMRLEVQLKVGVWIIYPMEIRILPAIVPQMRTSAPQPLPSVEERADESVEAPLLRFMEHRQSHRSKSVIPQTVREVIRRTAEQDMALAGLLDSKTLIPSLKEKLAASSAGGEWYLAIRDMIYRLSR
jgi:hypothetical protein